MNTKDNPNTTKTIIFLVLKINPWTRIHAMSLKGNKTNLYMSDIY